MISLFRLPRAAVTGTIGLYQATISPDHGPLRRFFPYGFCRFAPSCSEYTKQAVDKFGITLGLLKGVWRIFRCNPWSRGGHDPIA